MKTKKTTVKITTKYFNQVVFALITMMFLGSSSHALVQGMNPSLKLCNWTGGQGSFECGFILSVSLPTVLVDGENLNLNSEESSERLVIESRGDADPVVSSILAEKLNVKTEKVQETVQEMVTSGQAVTTISVIEKLSR